jgi:hypothetical protein
MQPDVANILQWEFVSAIYVCRLFRKLKLKSYTIVSNITPLLLAASSTWLISGMSSACQRQTGFGLLFDWWKIYSALYLCLWQALLIPEISQVELAARSYLPPIKQESKASL